MGTDPPIRIISDDDLVYQAGLYGWPGSGTVGDPYVISGQRINGSMRNQCISVSNVGLYLAIRDNVLFGTSRDEVTPRPGPISAIRLAYSSHVYVEHNVISDQEGDTHGIHLDTCPAVISNNSLANLTRGITGRLSRTHVVNNSLETEWTGIGLSDSDDAYVAGNRLVQNSTFEFNQGIDVESCEGLTVVDNELVGFVDGMTVERSSLLVRGNTITGCERGMMMTWSFYSAVADNVINCSHEGIRINECHDFNLSGNSLLGCGIHLPVDDRGGTAGTHTIDLTNTVNGLPVLFRTDVDGIQLDEGYGQVIMFHCSDVTLDNATMSPGFIGILAGDTEDVMMSHVVWRSAYDGLISVWNASNWSLLDCSLENVDMFVEGDGNQDSRNWSIAGNWMVNVTLDTYYMVGSAVLDNTFVNVDGTALDISSSQYNTIEGNVLTTKSPGFGDTGMTVVGTRFTRIANNSLAGAGFLLEWAFGRPMDYDFHDNTLNGRPVLLRSGTTGDSISGDYSQVILDGCVDAHVRGLDLSNSSIGIQMRTCQGTVVDDCRFSVMASYGVYSTNSEETTISNCTFVDCHTAIFYGGGERVLIDGNWMEGCEGDCIYVFADYVDILYNVILDVGDRGIILTYCDEVTVVGNYVGNCTLWAVYASYTADIHHNTFVDNAMGSVAKGEGQVYDPQGTITWDDGEEGNYWSDYRTRYPLAVNDGITWYTPYEVLGANEPVDRHPLVEPTVDPFPPVAMAHGDITVWEGEPFELNGSLSSDNLGIETYLWTLDDGSNIPRNYFGEVVSVRIDHPSEWLATLVVEDRHGNSGWTRFNVTVLENRPPLADAGEDVVVDQHTEVVLDGSGSTDDVGIASWVWTIPHEGGNITLSGETVSSTFDLAGMFTVILTVTDVLGKLDYDLLTVTVLDTEVPVPSMKREIEVVLGENVVLDASGSTDNVGITSYEWSFEYYGTPYILTGPTTHFTFHIPGVYPVTLTLSDAAGNIATAVVNVTVVDMVAPVFDPDTGTMQVSVTTVVVTLDLNWTLWSDDDARFPEVGVFNYSLSKDGETWSTSGQFATITLPGGGTYRATFTAVDASDNAAEHEFDIVVDWAPADAGPPTAHAGDDIEVTLGDRVTLRGTYDPGDLDAVLHEWSGPEGLALDVDEANATFTADRVGEMTFTYRVSDWMGNYGEDTVVVWVVPGTPVVQLVTDLSEVLTADVVVEGTAAGDVDIQRVEYRLDGGNWTAADGAADWSFIIVIEDLGTGEHTLEVRAWDGYSYGTDGPVTFTVRVPDKDGVDDGWPLWPMLVGVAIVVAFVLFLLVVRKDEERNR